MAIIKCEKCGCEADEDFMYEAHSPLKGRKTMLCSKCFSKLFALFDIVSGTFEEIDKTFWNETEERR